MTDPMRARLIEILKERSVRFGDFTLASGKKSDLYVDCRLTTLHPEGADLIARLLLDRLRPEVVAVGGPMSGADPIAGAVAVASFRAGRPLYAFMVRKQVKAHGTRNWVEGRDNIPDGAPVCVVEDTVTTGGSLIKALGHVEEAGLRVAQVITVVDRSEGAIERLAQAGYALEALISREDLL